jgi:hypothetical protein
MARPLRGIGRGRKIEKSGSGTGESRGGVVRVQISGDVVWARLRIIAICSVTVRESEVSER